MLAVVAAHAGEPAIKVAAVEELIDHLRDDGAQEAEPRLVPLLVGVQKPVDFKTACLGLTTVSGI